MMEDSNFATGYAVGRDSNGGYNNGNGMFGNDWAWIVILLLFGWGRNGFGNGFGGNYGCGAPCATQADVRSAVDQQTIISKIDQQTYGIADTFTALNNTLNNNFRGIDNAICTLGYQGAQHRQPTKIDGRDFGILPFSICKYTKRTGTENLPFND